MASNATIDTSKSLFLVPSIMCNAFRIYTSLIRWEGTTPKKWRWPVEYQAVAWRILNLYRHLVFVLMLTVLMVLLLQHPLQTCYNMKSFSQVCRDAEHLCLYFLLCQLHNCID